MKGDYRIASLSWNYAVQERAAELIKSGVAPWVAVYRATKEIARERRKVGG